MDGFISHSLVALVTILVCWIVIAWRNVKMVRQFQLIEGTWSNVGLVGAQPHEIRAAINAMKGQKVEPLKFWALQFKRGMFLVPDSEANMKFLVKIGDAPKRGKK